MVLGGVPDGDVLARIRSTVRESAGTPTAALVTECLGLIATLTTADRVALRSAHAGGTSVVGAHPLDLRAADVDAAAPADWLPWGLGGLRTKHFLFVRDARALPIRRQGDVRLADLGVHSAAWLPVCDHGRMIGSLTLCWAAPRDQWDDDAGPVVRNTARLLLGRLAADRRSPDQPWSSAPSGSTASAGRD